ncbi:hypothetical protein OIU84_002654, partial [Salix udensis]
MHFEHHIPQSQFLDLSQKFYSFRCPIIPLAILTQHIAFIFQPHHLKMVRSK